MAILVTGGAGYIGSHLVHFLTETREEIIVIDNLSRGNLLSLPYSVKFEKVNLLNKSELKKVISKYAINIVVHFAGFAYVGESVINPQMYYENNVIGSLNLISVCNELNIKKFLFSSTCSIYGNPQIVPINESAAPYPINPYANTKQIVETILKDYNQYYEMNFISLRYFNAAGAGSKWNIGESHNPEPHLIPIVINAALGKRDFIEIYGNDYETPDGTCIRDYIHVVDLADAHYKAVDLLRNSEDVNEVINLGTGIGASVIEIIENVERISGSKVKRIFAPRREGDPAILVADNSKAKEILGWEPQHDLNDIILSAYNWHKKPRY